MTRVKILIVLFICFSTCYSQQQNGNIQSNMINMANQNGNVQNPMNMAPNGNMQQNGNNQGNNVNINNPMNMVPNGNMQQNGNNQGNNVNMNNPMNMVPNGNMQQNGNNQGNNVNMNNGPFLPEVRDPSKVYRPCPDFDLNCIRQYFGKHSKYCKVSHGRVPEPVYRPESNLFYPFFNLTATQYGLHIFGLNGRITEFYVNEETDLVVLQVTFINVGLNSTKDIYRYHRPGRLPAITKSDSRALFPSFRTTTVFRGRDEMDLSSSVTTTFIDAIPALYINPSAGVHPDPVVSRTFSEFVANARIVLAEAYLTSGPYYAATYIQCTICDYGLKVT